MRLVSERIPLFVSGRVLYRKKDWLAFENGTILGATIYTHPRKAGPQRRPNLDRRRRWSLAAFPEFY